MSKQHVNAVVIGAGAGGGIVAKELSEAGLSVVLMERGGWPRFEQLDHDELSSQFYGVLPVKDYWGIHFAKLSGGRHYHDIDLCKIVASKAEAWLREAGASRIWLSIPGRGLGSGPHQAGTCRMGNDPKTSVRNRSGQLHDMDNLFPADGSLHVTNGGFNPVLTIMALAYWVSDYIKREWKGTRFRS